MILAVTTIITFPEFVLWGIPNAIFGTVLRLVGTKFNMPKTAQYGHNILISVSQFIATKWLGQDPDTTISMLLGITRKLHEKGKVKVDMFWLYFAKFVNLLFFFEKDHVCEAIERDECSKDAVLSIHDGSPKMRKVT